MAGGSSGPTTSADWEAWRRSQAKLIEWRRKHPVSDMAAMPGYDHVARWLAGYVQHGRLLEIGCKTGGLRLSSCFPASVEYHGLDPLRVDGADYAFPFYCQMAEEMDFADGHFQAVLIKDSFDYLPDPERVLRRIVRLLAPGGWLLLCEGDHPSRADRLAAGIGHGLARLLQPLLARSECLRRWARRAGIALRPARDFANTYPHGDYTRRQIARQAAKAGFEVVENRVANARLYLAGRIPESCS